MIEVHSTKAFTNLPCAHAQYFDKELDGSPGECASIHGYDRTVKLTFSGSVDSNGWIVPFGELKQVKEFIEYYFDHTTVLPADDPRVYNIPISMMKPGEILSTLRVLPYGVSMEMSSLFVWEWVSPFITSVTHGRCYVSKVECIEHERNSAFITVDRDTAMRRYQFCVDNALDVLPKERLWDYVNPSVRLSEL